MSQLIFKMITAKILIFDHLINILYVAVFIITILIELKQNNFKLK